MKRTFIISLLVAAMGMIAFMGCEKPEQVENPTTTTVASQTTETPATNPQGETTPVTHNTTLSYSGCHSGQRDGYDPIVSTNYENGILSLTIENFRVNCAMDSIFSELTIDNQTIDLNLKENYTGKQQNDTTACPPHAGTNQHGSLPCRGKTV